MSKKLPDFLNEQSSQIQGIDRKPSMITKKTKVLIILSSVLGLIVVCLLSVIALSILNHQEVSSLLYKLNIPFISNLTRPSDAECQQAYDSIAATTYDDGAIMNFLLNNVQAPDTVGNTAKSCIIAGWKPAPSVVPSRCTQAWIGTLLNSEGLAHVYDDSYVQIWLSNESNKSNPNWSYLQKCYLQGYIR